MENIDLFGPENNRLNGKMGVDGLESGRECFTRICGRWSWT